MDVFNKRSDLQKNEDKKEKHAEEKSVKVSKRISEIFKNLKVNCESQKELKLRIEMLKEMDEGTFIYEKKVRELELNKLLIENKKQTVEMVKDIDEKTIKKMERLSLLSKKDKTMKQLIGVNGDE